MNTAAVIRSGKGKPRPSNREMAQIFRACGSKRGQLDKVAFAAQYAIEKENLRRLDCECAVLKAVEAFAKNVKAALDEGHISEEEAELFVEWLKEDHEKEKAALVNELIERERINDMAADAEKNERMNTEIAAELVARSTENVAQQEQLVDRVQDAKLALELAVGTIRKDAVEFLKEMDGYLAQMRQTRFALDSETRQLLASAADVRKFFLSEEHQTEVARLKEFVSLCDGLKRLKESGFLDTVADTILKLESR